MFAKDCPNLKQFTKTFLCKLEVIILLIDFRGNFLHFFYFDLCLFVQESDEFFKYKEILIKLIQDCFLRIPLILKHCSGQKSLSDVNTNLRDIVKVLLVGTFFCFIAYCRNSFN